MSGNTDAPWRDEEVLYQKYVVERKPQHEVADELGVTQSTIGKWLRRHGIETRYRGQLTPCKFHTDNDGYERVETRSTRHDYDVSVPVYRLIAYAEEWIDFEDLTDRETHIHHKNGIRWDNRIENLEVMDSSEHMRHHKPWQDLEWVD